MGQKRQRRESRFGLLDLVDRITGVLDIDLELSSFWHLSAVRGFLKAKGRGRLLLLDLSGIPLTDAGLEQLKGLSQLQELDLSRTLVTNAAVDRLKGLRRLERLILTGSRVTTAGVAKLSQALPNCHIEGP